MLYTVISLDDIFYNYDKRVQPCRSSNPYDYLRSGYFLDNAELFGGENNVSYNCDISSHFSGANLYSAD